MYTHTPDISPDRSCCLRSRLDCHQSIKRNFTFALWKAYHERKENTLATTLLLAFPPEELLPSLPTCQRRTDPEHFPLPWRPEDEVGVHLRTAWGKSWLTWVLSWTLCTSPTYCVPQACWKVFLGLPGAQKVSYIGQLQSLDSNGVHADNFLEFRKGQLQSLDNIRC